MDAIGRRLKRLRSIQTELRKLDVDSAADAVGDEIASLERLPSDNPAVGLIYEMLEDAEKLDDPEGI